MAESNTTDDIAMFWPLKLGIRARAWYSSATLLFVCISWPAEAQTRQWETRLGPVEMSYQDLHRIVRRVVNNVEVPDNPEDDPLLSTDHVLEVTSGELTVTLRDQEVLSARLFDLPTSADRVSYRCERWRGEISEVWISLSNDLRILRVAGQNADEVEELYLILFKDFEGLSTIGGWGWAFALAFLTGALGALLLLRFQPKTSEKMFSIFSMVWGSTIAAVPWWGDLLLPRFSIQTEPLNWWERYSPEVGLAGLAAGIFSLALGLFRRRIDKRVADQPGTDDPRPDTPPSTT